MGQIWPDVDLFDCLFSMTTCDSRIFHLSQPSKTISALLTNSFKAEQQYDFLYHPELIHMIYHETQYVSDPLEFYIIFF